ncbi:hypothetical protein ACIOEW_40030 [Streptomyces sp. NPDC087901]|uniref:hypothetical protein n=1 Tax=unclassified Streptomyces TaxID=2593676 RepID=UPI00342660E2
MQQADPALTELHRVVDDLAAATHQHGELMLEVAPAYLSDPATSDVLAPLCEQIGEDLDNGLAATPCPVTAAPCPVSSDMELGSIAIEVGSRRGGPWGLSGIDRIVRPYS